MGDEHGETVDRAYIDRALQRLTSLETSHWGSKRVEEPD